MAFRQQMCTPIAFSWRMKCNFYLFSMMFSIKQLKKLAIAIKFVHFIIIYHNRRD